MKYLLLILLFPVVLQAQSKKPQQSTRWQGDSTFSVQLESYDTAKVKVYNKDSVWWIGDNWFPPRNADDYYMDSLDNTKLIRMVNTPIYGFGIISSSSDLLGWDISSTGKVTYFIHGEAYTKADTIGSWRLVSDTARDHWNEVSAMYVYEVRVYENQIKNNTGNRQDGMNLSLPKHFCWLDSKKKLLTAAVWSAKPE